MTNEIIISVVISIVGFIIVSLLGVCTFFLKKMIEKIEKNSEEMHHLRTDFQVIKTQFVEQKSDIEKSITMAEIVTRQQTEIDILKRDLATCFSKLDRLANG